MTSWNHVMLSDFAPFKPTFLADDGPEVGGEKCEAYQ